jgi:hypothetical protein
MVPMMQSRKWTKIHIFQLFGFITAAGIVIMFLAFNIVAIYEISLFPVERLKSSNWNVPLPRQKATQHQDALTPNSNKESAYYQMQIESMRQRILEYRREWKVRVVP